MKHKNIKDVASSYNCTIPRAAEEILCASGIKKRVYPCVIRKQKISQEMISKAAKILEFASRGVVFK